METIRNQLKNTIILQLLTILKKGIKALGIQFLMPLQKEQQIDNKLKIN